MTLLYTFRRRAVAALAVLMFAVPPAMPAGAAVFSPESFTLDNGMQVVVVSNRRAPVVTHMVWYRAGAMDEPPGRTGVAHLLEHLMFKGTKAYPDGAFSQIVARNGGQDNAFTSWDYTGYFQRVALDRLPLVMELEADRMSNLVLTDEVVDPERDVDLAGLGVTAPSATWTYLINDDPFRDQLAMVLTGPGKTTMSIGAALFAPFFFFLWLLVERLAGSKRKRN